jgi:hypothetical protein
MTNSAGRRCLEPGRVRLEVAASARAPDSEVLAERLKLLASAIGVKRSEVVDIGDPAPADCSRAP